MRDRCHLDRHFRKINAIVGETVNHRPEGFAQRALWAMLEAEVHPAMGRAAAGLDLLENRVTADVSRDDIFAVFGDAIALREFLHMVVKQPPTELVAERVPHDWVHAD